MISGSNAAGVRTPLKLFHCPSSPRGEPAPGEVLGATGGAAASQATPALVTGTHGNDLLVDPAGWSIVMAGAGNDTIVAPAGEPNDGLTDEYNGGAGIDAVNFSWAVNARIDVDLAAGTAFRFLNGVEWGHTTLVEIESVIGTAMADTIRGDALANTVSGGGGNDTIETRGGDDTAYGGDGNDVIDGGDGQDVLQGQAGDDTIVGGNGHDQLQGGDGNDVLHGGDGHDTLEGGLGNDTLVGGGGIGSDWALYHGVGAVVVNLTTGSSAGALGADTLSGIENVHGSSAGDFLTGDGAANWLRGDGGNDTLEGLAGNDMLEGGTGNDFLYGGSGFDTAVFAADGGAVQVSLVSNTATGALGSDTLDSIEGVVVSGWGAAQLTGNNAANLLDGSSGNDVIVGGGGDDTLRGRGGNDDIRGGQGADVIEVGGGADILRWGAGDIGTDLVREFVLGVDKVAIDQAFFGANLGPGNTAEDVLFAFLAPGGDALLMAHNAIVGWTAIARFEDTSASALNDAISNGSLFHAQVGGLGGGGPGELFG